MGNEIKKDDYFVECRYCGYYHREHYYGACHNEYEHFTLTEIEDACAEYEDLEEG